jgi:DnaJ-class molecular chaperone
MLTKVECPGCGGWKTVVCPVCEGNRFIRPWVANTIVDCPQCHGTGRLVCKMCGGVGSVLVETQPANR